MLYFLFKKLCYIDMTTFKLEADSTRGHLKELIRQTRESIQNIRRI